MRADDDGTKTDMKTTRPANDILHYSYFFLLHFVLRMLIASCSSPDERRSRAVLFPSIHTENRLLKEKRKGLVCASARYQSPHAITDALLL